MRTTATGMPAIRQSPEPHSNACRRIFEANRDALSDPHAIEPSQVLTIPSHQ